MNNLQNALEQLCRRTHGMGHRANLLPGEAQVLLDERGALRGACEALIAACNEQANFTGLRLVVGKAIKQAEAALKPPR